VPMSVNCGESNWAKAASLGNASHGCDRQLKPRRDGAWHIAAVVIGGTGQSTLGVVRSLSRANGPVTPPEETASARAMRSRCG
jgi:hypothetical protein